MAKTKTLTFKPRGVSVPPLSPEIDPSAVHAVTCLWQYGKVGRRPGWVFRDAVPLDGDGRIILASDGDRLLDDGRDGGNCSWWTDGLDCDDGTVYRVPATAVRAVTVWTMTDGVRLRSVTRPNDTGVLPYNSGDPVMRAFWQRLTPDGWQLANSTALVVRYLFGWVSDQRWNAFNK